MENSVFKVFSFVMFLLYKIDIILNQKIQEDIKSLLNASCKLYLI